MKKDCFSNGKNDGINVFEVEGNMRGINGSVSFTVIDSLKFLNINYIINHLFQSYHVLKWVFSYQHRLLECKLSYPN